MKAFLSNNCLNYLGNKVNQNEILFLMSNLIKYLEFSRKIYCFTNFQSCATCACSIKLGNTDNVYLVYKYSLYLKSNKKDLIF